MSISRRDSKNRSSFRELIEQAEDDKERMLLEDLSLEEQEIRLSTNRVTGLSLDIRAARLQQSLSKRTENKSGDVVARRLMLEKFYVFVNVLLSFVAFMLMWCYSRWKTWQHCTTSIILGTLAVIGWLASLYMYVERLLKKNNIGKGSAVDLSQARVEVIIDGGHTVVDGHDVVEGDLMQFKEGDVFVTDALIVKGLNACVSRDHNDVEEKFTITKDDLGRIVLPAGTIIEKGRGTAIAVKPPQLNVWEEEAQDAIHRDFAQHEPNEQKRRHIIRGFCLFHVAAFTTVGGTIDDSFLLWLGVVLITIGWFVFAVTKTAHTIMVARLGRNVCALGLTEEVINRFRCLNVLLTPSTGIITKRVLSASKFWVWGANDKTSSPPSVWTGAWGSTRADELVYDACVLASGVARRIKPSADTAAAGVGRASSSGALSPVESRGPVTEVFDHPALGKEVGSALAKMALAKGPVQVPFQVLKDSRAGASDVEATALGGERVFWAVTQNPGGGPLTLYAVGAASALIGQCTHMLVNGVPTSFENHHVTSLSGHMGSMEGHMIGFAFRTLDEMPTADDFEPSDMTFIGLAVLTDLVTEGSLAAVKRFMDAKKRVVLTTEDSVNSIVSDARAVGLVTGPFPSVYVPLSQNAPIPPPPSFYITGRQLATLTPSDWDHITTCESDILFAEVSGGQKCMVCIEFQKRGYSVAAVGSEVNETGLLLRADIGIATGTYGTAVARASADVVLISDTIVSISDVLDLSLRDLALPTMRFLKFFI